MKHLLLTVLFCFVFTIAGSANTYKLTNYATPGDGQDDSAGFQAAIDDLISHGGGTLLITEGEWILDHRIDLQTFEQIQTSIVIKGTKGAVIFPFLPNNEILFSAANYNQLTFEDLVVVGNMKIAVDFGGFVEAGYVNQFRMKGCQFYGLRSGKSLIHLGNTDGVITNTLFHGLSGNDVIYADNTRGLSVIDSEFIDYGHFNGDFYSKTPMGIANWIRIENAPLGAGVFSRRTAKIENVKFDEGANYCIAASGIPFLQVSGISVNVSTVTIASALLLSNVKYAEVKMSQFGYTQYPRPAITALDHSVVYIDSILVDNGVFYGIRDATSDAIFNPTSCPACSFKVKSPEQEYRLKK
jgi:hypothetical protein